MTSCRIIPCLLLMGHGLVKTKKFKQPVYVGDPINAVRIFSEKEVDELVILDIDATREKREPNYELIAEIAGECFMPVAYGGGIRTVAQAREIIRCGIEKVVINSATFESTNIISDIANIFGSQAVVGSIDAKKCMFGAHRVFLNSGTVDTKVSPEDHAISLERAGAGEIFLNSIDCDGQMQGYDIPLLKKVSSRVRVPIVACGGAGSVDDMRSAVNEGGVSAVAAGSIFVFYGKHRAVLISYPNGLII